MWFSLYTILPIVSFYSELKMSNQKKLFTLCHAWPVACIMPLYYYAKHYAVSSSTPTLMVHHCSRKYIVENKCLLLLACWTNTRPDIGAHSSSRIEQGPLIPSDQRPWTTSNKHFIIRAKSLKNESTRARSRRVQQCPHQCATPAVRRCAGGLSAAALAVVMRFSTKVPPAWPRCFWRGKIV